MESNSAFCVSVWPGPHKVWLEGGGWEEGKELCDPWFYSKSDIVGLSAGDLCPCIVNNCYYFRHPCFIRFLGSYSVTFILVDVDIVRQMSPSKKNQCPVDVLDLDRYTWNPAGFLDPKTKLAKPKILLRFHLDWEDMEIGQVFCWKFLCEQYMSKSVWMYVPHWKLQNIPWATQLLIKLLLRGGLVFSPHFLRGRKSNYMVVTVAAVPG